MVDVACFFSLGGANIGGRGFGGFMGGQRDELVVSKKEIKRWDRCSPLVMVMVVVEVESSVFKWSLTDGLNWEHFKSLRFITKLVYFALIFTCFLACSGCLFLFCSLHTLLLLVSISVQHALRFLAINF